MPPPKKFLKKGSFMKGELTFTFFVDEIFTTDGSTFSTASSIQLLPGPGRD